MVLVSRILKITVANSQYAKKGISGMRDSLPASGSVSADNTVLRNPLQVILPPLDVIKSNSHNTK